MSFLKRLRGKLKPKPIIIVSGLPRSGTSMMMKMLEAGGLEPVIDNIRTADEDNPKGYYEFERVKKIKEDQVWLDDAQGKVVKVISMLLLEMPPGYQYKVLFMRREMDEILASQKKMLIRRNEPTDKVSDEELAQLYEKHLKHADKWMQDQPNVDYMYVNYNEIIQDPTAYIVQINEFLGGDLDTEKMDNIIDRKLYRQRA